MRILRSAFVVVAATLGPTAIAQVSDGEVRVGILTDLTGVYSDGTGKGSVAATEMAVADFVRLEKPGFKVKTVVADHLNKVDFAANKAREWFDLQGVDVITDVVNSTIAVAVSKVAVEKDRVVLVVGSGSNRLTNEDCNANTANWAYDTYALATSLATAVVRQHGDTWFMLVVDYTFGLSLQSDATRAIEAAGGKVLGSVKFPLGNMDFSSTILQAKSSPAKVIGLAAGGGDVRNALKTAREFGINEEKSIAPFLFFITDVDVLGLEAAQGMLVTEGFYWNQSPESAAWSRRFFAIAKRMPSTLQAAQYSAVLHYLRAVKATGTDKASTVMAKMRATPINDVFAKGGKLRDDGRMVHDMYVYEVKTPAESKEPWDYYKLRATVPANEAFSSLAASKCPLVKR